MSTLHTPRHHIAASRRPATIRHRASLLEDAVAIVEAEYATQLTLNQIARRVASSRRQLQRAYAEIGRTTFREHLNAVRMRHATALLESSDLGISEIGRRVGYRSAAHFSKTFRQHHGMLPSAFRRRT